jgi:hypothetical protein
VIRTRPCWVSTERNVCEGRLARVIPVSPSQRLDGLFLSYQHLVHAKRDDARQSGRVLEKCSMAPRRQGVRQLPCRVGALNPRRRK